MFKLIQDKKGDRVDVHVMGGHPHVAVRDDNEDQKLLSGGSDSYGREDIGDQKQRMT